MARVNLDRLDPGLYMANAKRLLTVVFAFAKRLSDSIGVGHVVNCCLGRSLFKLSAFQHLSSSTYVQVSGSEDVVVAVYVVLSRLRRHERVCIGCT